MENNTKNDIAIQISGLKKRYRLGTIGGGTLQGDIQSWWARVRKKEDPNLRIGQKRGNKNEIFTALDGIDLTIRKGERLGIIGHNGAGKSTLLKLLSRVTAPTEGTICIDGRISSMLEVGTGFNGELTGRENIYLNGAILGMSKAEVDSKIDDIIEFSECAKFIDTPVKRYSSGMYVKLAFAVAAHLDSEILIMDEVLAVGDMKFQQKCLGKMSDVSQSEGRTVLYVSHNMNTIRQLCERCIVMDHGRIIYEGDVEEAIGIYMDQGMQDMRPKLDLGSISRGNWLYEAPGLLNSVTLLDTENCIFESPKKMRLNIVMQSEKDYEQVMMRIIIRYADKTTVGMMSTAQPFDIMKGTNEGEWEFDISYLPEGKYYVTMSVYYLNEFGAQSFFDVVNDAFRFEVVRTVEEQGIAGWNHNVYGHIILPSIEKTK